MGVPRMDSPRTTSSHFDQNHDQVGNRGWGERIEHLIGTDAAKVSLGLLLTAPYIPMLFMGQEWATSAPFLFFADHEDEDLRKQGRGKAGSASLPPLASTATSPIPKTKPRTRCPN